MGWVAFAASATYRRRFLANARQAGYGLGAVAPAVGHAGRMVAELPRMWMGRQPSCEMHNEECVRRAYAAGRGIIIQPLLEAVDTLGEITHQIGNAATAEQQHDDQDDHQPMREAERTHDV